MKKFNEKQLIKNSNKHLCVIKELDMQQSYGISLIFTERTEDINKKILLFKFYNIPCRLIRSIEELHNGRYEDYKADVVIVQEHIIQNPDNYNVIENKLNQFENARLLII